MKLWQFDAEKMLIQWLKFGWKKMSGYWNIVIKIELQNRTNRHFMHRVIALFFFPSSMTSLSGHCLLLVEVLQRPRGCLVAILPGWWKCLKTFFDNSIQVWLFMMRFDWKCNSISDDLLTYFWWILLKKWTQVR